MCAFATPFRGGNVSYDRAVRWLIGAVALGCAFAVMAPEPVDSRPRSGKSRISKSEAREPYCSRRRARRGECERGKSEQGKSEQGRSEAAGAERADAQREKCDRRRSRRGKAERCKPEPAAVPLAVQPPPEEIPELPTRRAAPPPPEWPRAATPLGPEAPPDVWPDAEVKEALAQCRQRLGDVRFEFRQLEPLKKGVCGNPAPISLKFINDTPRVEVRPAATISCPLAAAVDRWLTEVVQPRAKDLLDATVIRVVNLSGYDCRMRNGTPTQRMSYHAWAEALDIAEFVTAKGEHINVLEHWNAGDERAQFLREIHDGGCKIFGTVLGPEANAAHHNHFHVDMAKRRRTAFCE